MNIFAFIVLGISLLFGTSTTQAADDWGFYPDCRAPAIPMEVHSWWKEPSEQFPRHVHTAACLPNARNTQGPLVSGGETFWIRSVTYNQPGRVESVRARWGDEGFATKKGDPRNASICRAHPVTGLEECIWYDDFALSLTLMRYDEDELRLRTVIVHDDLLRKPSQWSAPGFQVRRAIDGTHKNPVRNPFARAWYTNQGYAVVDTNYQDLIPEDRSIPLVNGTVSLYVRHTDTAGGKFSRKSVAWENVDFHACPSLWEEPVAVGDVVDGCGPTMERPARKLYEVSGLWKGTLNWDTTKVPNGINFVYIQTQVQRSDGAMNAGAMKLLFEVMN